MYGITTASQTGALSRFPVAVFQQLYAFGFFETPQNAPTSKVVCGIGYAGRVWPRFGRPKTQTIALRPLPNGGKPHTTRSWPHVARITPTRRTPPLRIPSLVCAFLKPDSYFTTVVCVWMVPQPDRRQRLCGKGTDKICHLRPFSSAPARKRIQRSVLMVSPPEVQFQATVQALRRWLDAPQGHALQESTQCVHRPSSSCPDP